MGLAALATAGAVAAGAPWLLRIWLGRTYDGLESVLLLLLALQVVNAARSNCAIVIVALGKAGLGARAKAIAVVVNALATVALVIPFGISGVLVGTIAASAVQNAFLIRRYAAMLETSVRTVLWQWYGPLLSVTVVAFAAARLVGLTLPSGAHLTLFGAAVGTVVAVSVFCLVFAAGLRTISYLHHDDLTYLSDILPGPLGRIPRWSILHLVARGDR